MSHLDDRYEDALGTFLLDTYVDRPNRDTEYVSERPFLDACPYFDANGYPEVDSNGLPVRTYEQIHRKIQKGGSAYDSNLQLPRETELSWRTLYEQLQVQGHVRDYFRDVSHDLARLTLRIKKGELALDQRLCDYFATQVHPSGAAP